MDGLKRIVKAEVVPLTSSKIYKQMIPVSYDCVMASDQSSSAHWFYIWGLKGRYDEAQTQKEADLGHMNEHNRHL